MSLGVLHKRLCFVPVCTVPFSWSSCGFILWHRVRTDPGVPTVSWGCWRNQDMSMLRGLASSKTKHKSEFQFLTGVTGGKENDGQGIAFCRKNSGLVQACCLDVSPNKLWWWTWLLCLWKHLKILHDGIPFSPALPYNSTSNVGGLNYVNVPFKFFMDWNSFKN